MEKRKILVNGYVYPSVNPVLLKETAAGLTFVSLFSYGITKEGTLLALDDTKIINNMKELQVASLMVVSALTEEGVFNSELAEGLLGDKVRQNVFIEELLKTVEEKGFLGVDFDFEYIRPEYKDAYVCLIGKTRRRFNKEGYLVSAAVAPKTSTEQKGLLYEGHDYEGIGRAANFVLVMTYEWGYAYGPPMAVAPINKVREVLDYAVTQIPSGKLLMGIPNYGYDWTLPYVKGESKATSISNPYALELAKMHGAEVLYDSVAQAPHFTYQDEKNRTHEVWFEDGRSIEAKLKLVEEYNLAGVSYWNLMRPFPANWEILNQMYEVVKVI